MPGGYYTCGKQVLWGGKGVADARDNAMADLIADALNGYHAATYRDAIMPELTTAPAVPAVEHNTWRERDGSHACSCGARWDADEGSEHP